MLIARTLPRKKVHLLVARSRYWFLNFDFQVTNFSCDFRKRGNSYEVEVSFIRFSRFSSIALDTSTPPVRPSIEVENGLQRFLVGTDFFTKFASAPLISS